MKKVMKKGMLWCLILMLVLTFQSLSASAATKKANLKAPTVSNWKKTWDGSWNTPKSDGVEYTITWKKVAGASGYQIKKCSYSIAGSSMDKSKARVRAYKVVNGKKQYGPWSKTKVSVKWW